MRAGSRRRHGSNGFGSPSGGRGVKGRRVVGRGPRWALVSRLRGGTHQPLGRHDRLLRRQRFTESVLQRLQLRYKMAV